MPSPARYNRARRRSRGAHAAGSSLAAWTLREVTMRDLERVWRRSDRRRGRRQALEAAWWAALVMFCVLAWWGAYEATGALSRLL